MTELGEVLGVRFEYDPYPMDGFQLTLTNIDTEEVLFDNRMILYTLWEAVVKACFDVWDQEITKSGDDELPTRIAAALGIEESYEDDE